MKISRYLLALVVPVALAAPILFIPDKDVKTIYEQKQNIEYVQDRETDVTGNFTLSRGKYYQKNKLTVFGNFTLECGAEYIPSNYSLVIGTKGKNSLLRVEKCPITIVDPAVYSGATLIVATGSHIESRTPSLGNVIIQ